MVGGIMANRLLGLVITELVFNFIINIQRPVVSGVGVVPVNFAQVVDDISKAREVVEFRQDKAREQDLNKGVRVSLDELYAQMEAGVIKDLPNMFFLLLWLFLVCTGHDT